MAGRRSLVAMKHVGLNVCADPFINSALVAIHGGLVLALTAAIFLLGRVLHAFGMDSDTVAKPRVAGMFMTLLPMLGLVIAAVLAALGAI